MYLFIISKKKIEIIFLYVYNLLVTFKSNLHKLYIKTIVLNKSKTHNVNK